VSPHTMARMAELAAVLAFCLAVGLVLGVLTTAI
jgi:hypothetical protein